MTTPAHRHPGTRERSSSTARPSLALVTPVSQAIHSRRPTWPADDSWRSRTGVSFAMEGIFLRVYDAAGQRIMPLRELPLAIAAERAAREVAEEQARREAQARLIAEEELTRLRAELERRNTSS